MKQFHNIFASLAVGAALVFTLAGCSGKDVTLPAQLDMRPGETVALIDVAKYTGTEMVGAADTLNLLSEAQSKDSALEFEFASDAPYVADVSDQGVVTAYSVGDANITASCEALDFSAEMTVRVRGYATALDVDDTVQLEQGATYALTTLVDGPVTITYESAAPTIASVDEYGVITALRDGETTITAKIPGSSLQDTCVVTIGDAVQSVSLSSAAATLAPGERMRLVAGTWPTVDTAATWKSADETVATVADGMVTALTAGTTEITATVGGKTAGCTVTVALPATPETAATAETAAADAKEKSTPETAMTESDFDVGALFEDAEPDTEPAEPAATEEADPAEPEETADNTEPATAEKTPRLEDYILQLVDDYAKAEASLPALQYVGPGPVVLPSTPETAEIATPETPAPKPTPQTTATPETATPETATAETATPAAATPETSTPESSLSDVATAETAAPPMATPENAQDILGGVVEKTGDFFSSIAEKLGSLFGFKP